MGLLECAMIFLKLGLIILPVAIISSIIVCASNRLVLEKIFAGVFIVCVFPFAAAIVMFIPWAIASWVALFL